MQIRILDLLTPNDVAKDSALLTIFTSPWAFLGSLDTALIIGLVQALVLAFFRWRALRLREKELQLHYSEELRSTRQRLARYEQVEPLRLPGADKPGRPGRLALLARKLFAGGTPRRD